MLRRDNIPRTEIDGGFEYDSETQLDATGHMNEASMKAPAGVFRPHFPPAGLPHSVFLGLTPAIVPKYFLFDKVDPALARVHYPPVEYTTIMPPFHRWIYIEQPRKQQ